MPEVEDLNKSGDNAGQNQDGAADGNSGEEELEFVDDGKGPAEDPAPKTDPAPVTNTDDDDDPEEKAKIDRAAQKIVERELAPIREQAEKARVKNEWSDIKAQFPELAKFEPKILRYAGHKNYQGRPVIQAIIDAAGVDIFVKIGAMRSKKANVEAADTRGGGSSAKGAPAENSSKIPSFKGKTPAEINKILSDVKRGKYNES